MKYLFLLLTFKLLIFTSYSQDYHKIDSLKQILSNLPPLSGTDEDTTRMNDCIKMGILYEKICPDSAIICFMMVADTVFNQELIKKYPNRAKKNSLLLTRIAIIAKNKGNYKMAISFNNYSLKISEEIGDDKGIFAYLSNMGVISKHLGQYYKAISYYERALKIAEKLGDKNGISSCLMNMGVVASKQGNYPLAISYYEKSLKIAEELKDKMTIGKCLSNLANVMMFQGNFPLSAVYNERSLKISEELGDNSGISSCLGNLGVLAMYKADNTKAILFFEQALKLNEQLSDKKGISVCLANLGNVSVDHGNYPLAISYYESALKIYEELGEKASTTSCLTNMGVVASLQENYSKAVLCLDLAMKIQEEVGDKSGLSYSLSNYGLLAMKQGDYSKAISFHEQALKIKEELGDKIGISNCLSNIGTVFYTQGKYSDAIEYFEKAIKYFEEIGTKSSLSLHYSSMARAYIRLNKPEKAETILIKCKNLNFFLLKDNFSLLSEKEKERYFEKSKNVFNDLLLFNFLYPKQNDSITGICYNNELVLKGLFLKSTKTILDVVSNSSDTTLKNSYFYLKQLRNQISEMQVAKINNRDSVIAELEKQANEQERKLVRLSSEFADVQNLFDYRWEDVQKALKPGDAAIEFVNFAQDDKNDTIVYAAFLITSECKQPLSIKLFYENELESIFSKTSEADYRFINSFYGENNEALYDLVWKSLETYLTGINTIYYAPVGVLNKISFATLSKESGKMLCDDYNLYQLSTTGKLINRNEEITEIETTAAVFGGIDYNPDSVKIAQWQYLPGTLKEKEIIEKQLEKNKIKYKSFAGKEAKEQSFKALFDSTDTPSILHVSTHGFFYQDPKTREGKREQSRDTSGERQKTEINFRGSSGFGNWMFVNNKNPMMRSGLVFAGANKIWSEEWGKTDNEGVLTAYEVSNLNMSKTQLVVLSACETGLGDIKGSEGVYGLQRAFKMAGVKYIIMSLWQVPDKETVEFMETFYKKLLKIKDVRTAFTETQKEKRQKYDPYYWAAFVLVE